MKARTIPMRPASTRRLLGPELHRSVAPVRLGTPPRPSAAAKRSENLERPFLNRPTTTEQRCPD